VPASPARSGITGNNRMAFLKFDDHKPLTAILCSTSQYITVQCWQHITLGYSCVLVCTCTVVHLLYTHCCTLLLLLK
jgi:hypothetical protein